jgi:hypothetical protein
MTYTSAGNNLDEGRSIALDASSNVYVTGVLAYSEGKASTDDWGTIKYDSSGGQQWVRVYDDPAHIADEAFSIAVDANGSSYVVGYSHGTTSGSDLTSVKYDTDGNEQWVQAYDGPLHGTDSGFDITLDIQGNVYVVGASGLDAAIDYATIKYSQAGGPTPTPTPTPTPSSTATPTAPPTATPTATPSVTPTATPSATPRATPRPRPSPHPRPIRKQ